MNVKRKSGLVVAGLVGLAATASAGQVRVQDIARLQGQRTNKLMGYGLVVGLAGTGDGEKYAATMRALMRLHQRFHAPVVSDADLKGNRSVALVVVEATIPEYGARSGQRVDVVVSVLGAAKGLKGGQLLSTPLQYALFDENDPATQLIYALAQGPLELPDERNPTRAIIRGGATLEEDCIYSFVADGAITLVLDDAHAGWAWAHMLARAVNHELAAPAGIGRAGDPADEEPAVALGPKEVRVRIPEFERDKPAGFVSRVLQTPLFMLPPQPARVVINRTTRNISFTGAVTVSPTVLQLPGLGSIVVGRAAASSEDPSGDRAAPRAGGPPDGPPAAPGAAPGRGEAVGFGELLEALAAVRASPAQMVEAVEHLHKTGSLHAQLLYE